MKKEKGVFWIVVEGAEILRYNTGDGDEQVTVFANKTGAENDAFDYAAGQGDKVTVYKNLRVVRVRLEFIDDVEGEKK